MQHKKTGNIEHRVLVVIPTLGKRNDLLVAALESIANQSFQYADIVLVYPLKNEGVSILAKRFGAMEIDDPGSMSAAVNSGIAAAKPCHKYIGWIGDDDLLTPDSLKISVGALEKNTDAVLAFGYCDYINLKGERIFTSRAGRFAPWLMTWGPDLVPMPGILLRRTSLQKAGEFDVESKWAMDLDMLLRLRKIGRFINTKSTLACFRWHETSQTVSNRSEVLKEAEVIKRKYLPRSLRLVAPLWESPVRIVTIFAANRVNKRARRLG